LDRLEAILMRQDFEFAEFQGSVLSLLLGIWLLFPIVHERSPTVAALGSVMPSRVWAVVFLAVGFAQFVGLLEKNYRLRRQSSFAALMLWLFVSMIVGWTDVGLITFPLLFSFAVGAAWGHLRIRRLRERVAANDARDAMERAVKGV